MQVTDQSTIETTDGCYFTIIGNIHPPGRYVGLVTYVPSEAWHSGARKRIGDAEYTKISRMWFENFKEYERHLGSYSRYLYEDAFFGAVTSVPEDMVKQIIKPVPVSGIAVDACRMLDISPDDAVLVGSSMLECDYNGDIDLGIVGRKNVMSAWKNLRRLIEIPEYRVHHDYFGCPH